MSTADAVVKQVPRPVHRPGEPRGRGTASRPMSTASRPTSTASRPVRTAGALSGSHAVPLEADASAETPRDTARRDTARRDPLRMAARVSPLLGLAVSIGLVWWGWQAGVLRSLENLQAFIDGLGVWGPSAFLVVSVASVIFPVIPGGLLVISAPVLFGPVEGTIYNYLAVCAGSFANFAIGRQVGLGLIERMFSPKAVEKALGWTRSPHFTRLFATAIALPVAPDDLLCYLAGTTKMRWRTYLLIILTCKPWSLIAYGLGVSTLLVKFVPW